MEYHTFGGGELMALLFNAVAAYTATGEFEEMAAAAALTGIVFGALGTLHSLDMQAAVRWSVTAVVVYFMMVVPRTTVVVTDVMTDEVGAARLYGTHPRAPRPVDNVPLLLAVAGHASSLVGVRLTEAFEDLLSVPEERRIGAGGLFVIHRTLRAMMEGHPLRDRRLKEDFVHHMRNCVFFDVEVDRRYGYAELLDGAALDHLGNTGDRVTSVTLPDGSRLATTCRGAWHGGSGVHGDSGTTRGLRARIDAEAAHQKAMACLGASGYLLGLTPAQVGAIAADLGDPGAGSIADCGTRHMDATLDFLGLSARPAGERIGENLAVELIRDYAYTSPDIDPVALATAKGAAERGRNSSYVVMGQVARETLPVIRGAFEAVALMLFPVVIVLALVVPERMPQYIRMHLVLILWLQLWPPLMAVVNELASLSARDAMAKYSALAQGEIGYATFDPVLDEISLHQATASYLLVLVPLLAYYLAKGTDFAGAILASRFLQPSEGLVASQSGSVATGNWTMDQVNMAPTLRAGSPLARQVDPGGNTLVSTPSGRQFLELGSQLSAVAQGAQTAALSSASADALTLGESQRRLAAQTAGSAYAEGFARLRDRVDSAALAETHQGRDLSSERRGLSIIREAHRELTDEAGITREESARALGAIAANIGLGISVFGQGAGLDTSANVSKTVMERALDSVRSRLGESEARGTEDVRAFAREYARSEEFREASTVSVSGASRTSEEFRRAHQLATEAGASLSKSTELSEQARLSEQQQLTAALDLLRNQPHIGRAVDERVREHLAQGGNMEGARQIVQEELGKNGLFNIEIDGETLTPRELSERAREAFLRVEGQGPETPGPDWHEKTGLLPEGQAETLMETVRDKTGETPDPEEVLTGPGAHERAIPADGSQMERVVTRLKDALSREATTREGKDAPGQ